MTLENHKNYNCIVYTDSNQHYYLSANWIHNNKLDNWEGWQCYAGVNRIYIDDDNVYGGNCFNDYLGSLSEGWELFYNTTTCKRKTCTGCTDDLMIEKYAPVSTQSSEETEHSS